MTDTKILVTGATGTTGGAIVTQLDAAGINVRALSRDAEKGAKLASDHVEIAVGDLGDKASLIAAMEGIEAAYLNVVPGAETLNQIDNFIEAAKQAGVRHIVKLSGMNAGPDSPSAIIRMHAEGDRRVRESGLTYSILRANSFFQNVLAQIGNIRDAGQFYLPLGDAHQSLIDVADIAAVAIARLREENPVSGDFDLSGPQSLTFFDVATELGKALGKEVTYVPISNDAFRDNLIKIGLPEPAANNVAELFGVFASGTYANVSGGVEKVLGRPPRSYSEFAADVARMN